MASVLKVDKLDPQSGTALEIGTSGDTVSIPSGATLDISSATLTPPATLPASSGVNLTALNASNLGSGTVPTARLGTGTASSSTVLYGDQTYKAEPGGGKLLQVQSMTYSTQESTTATSWQNSSVTDSITPASTSNKILVMVSVPYTLQKTGTGSAGTRARSYCGLYRGDASGTELIKSCEGFNLSPGTSVSGHVFTGTATYCYLDSPSTTSAQSYTFVYKSSNATEQIIYVNSFYYASSASAMTLIEIDGT